MEKILDFWKNFKKLEENGVTSGGPDVDN